MTTTELASANASELDATEARELTDLIKINITVVWGLVGEAYTGRVWVALGYPTWDDYCTQEFGTEYLVLPREERREVVASLRDRGLSVRAIAAATGTGVGTIHRELTTPVPNGTPQLKPALKGIPGAKFRVPLNGQGSEPIEFPKVDVPWSGQSSKPEIIDAEVVEEEPAKITGVDGKAYPVRPAGPQRRKSLPLRFEAVGSELFRVARRIQTTLQTDDRFKANKAAISDACARDVRYTIEVLEKLLDDLGTD